MVWIYGGGCSQGSGATELYNGSALANQGVVVVTFNYRVGAFGWLGVSGETDAAGHLLAENFGLTDQIEALRWVRDFIVAFGGDPNKVTIFGESVGAYSVCALMGSPEPDGLYHRTIMQSGSCLIASRRLSMDATCRRNHSIVSMRRDAKSHYLRVSMPMRPSC